MVALRVQTRKHHPKKTLKKPQISSKTLKNHKKKLKKSAKNSQKTLKIVVLRKTKN
jgi:hypothetical protein